MQSGALCLLAGPSGVWERVWRFLQIGTLPLSFSCEDFQLLNMMSSFCRLCLSKSISNILPLICSSLWWNFCLWWVWLDLANSSATGFGNKTDTWTRWDCLVRADSFQTWAMQLPQDWSKQPKHWPDSPASKSPFIWGNWQQCLPIVACSAKTDWFTWTAIANTVTVAGARHGQQ